MNQRIMEDAVKGQEKAIERLTEIRADESTGQYNIRLSNRMVRVMATLRTDEVGGRTLPTGEWVRMGDFDVQRRKADDVDNVYIRRAR